MLGEFQSSITKQCPTGGLRRAACKATRLREAHRKIGEQGAHWQMRIDEWSEASVLEEPQLQP